MPRVKKWELKSSYLEFYKDPRWQKKRLEVMQRDGFECRSCESQENTLNVHHCYYEDGKMPWEYESSSLVTLCEQCHLETKEGIKEHKSLLLKTIATMGVVYQDGGFPNEDGITGWSEYGSLISSIQEAQRLAGIHNENSKRIFGDNGDQWDWTTVISMALGDMLDKEYRESKIDPVQSNG